ncbi:hypothetical protein ACH5RR_007784 [Cinchona calisaya]|uniref:AIPP2-like SPOC-like domain-containing protein n=1 Tax=Cinchona calisaya TaxID=153742 RepID=A0ABD3A9T5_9GENT
MDEDQDHPTFEPHLDKCCDICGDIGVIDAINTCSHCKISCEHLYCMRAYVECPQKDWCCDDCCWSNEMLSPTSGTMEDLARGSPLSTASRLCQNSDIYNYEPCDSRQNQIDHGKKIPPGKVEYIRAEEVIMLSSGAKKSGSPVKFACSSNLMSQKNAASALEKDAIQAPLAEHMQREQCKDTFRDTAEIKVEKKIPKTASASSPASCGQASDDAFPDVELQRTNPKTANPVRKCLSDPASDASWNGSFKIYNDPKHHREMNDGIQAYPPSRVRKKVYEFSKLMPEVLQFELVPRGDLWANLFQNYCLDKGDIGLYFFPSNTRRCKNYISLLEVMGAEDLAMRSLMDGVELLIFTSKVLRLDCQKWRGRHFLWGIFHSLSKYKKHASQVDAHEFHAQWASNQDIDMEIDMIAGEEVGRMDVAVPRESLQLVPSTMDITASSEGCNEDMEIDMIGGEEVGRMDVAVSREYLEVLPLAVDVSDSREACNNISPGLDDIYRPIKIERPDVSSC